MSTKSKATIVTNSHTRIHTHTLALRSSFLFKFYKVFIKFLRSARKELKFPAQFGVRDLLKNDMKNIQKKMNKYNIVLYVIKLKYCCTF